MEIKNLESSIVGNASELKGLQKELGRQTEIIYNVVSDKMNNYTVKLCVMLLVINELIYCMQSVTK